MNAKNSRRTGRPRLDSNERDRLLAEIAKFAAPATTEIDDQSAQARAVLTEMTDDPAGLANTLPESEPEIEPKSESEAVPEPVPLSESKPEQTPEPEPPTEPQTPDPAADPQATTITSRPQRQRTTQPTAPDPYWSALPMMSVEPGLLERNLVITAKRTDPAHGAFDVLRTRLVQALAEKGWNRVAITSPTAGCGKSFTAINLAVTLSRYDQCRTVLMDLDLHKPSLSRYLGAENPGSSGDYLRGLTPAQDYFTRLRSDRLNIGSNLAIGLNGRVEEYAAELFQQPSTTDVLAQMEEQFQPEVVLFDLPPALAQDDVIAFRPHFDCLLMVVGGGMTTAEEVREAQRRIGEDKPVLGIVLNKAEVEGDYSY